MKTMTLRYTESVKINLQSLIVQCAMARHQHESQEFGVDGKMLLDAMGERQEEIMEGAIRPDWEQMRRILRSGLRLCLEYLEDEK